MLCSVNDTDSYLYFLLYIFSTSFVLTPFLRGLHSMPAGSDVQGSRPQSRIWLTVCSAPLSRSFILVYTSAMLLCYFHSGYDGGPVSSFVSVYLFRGLWTCCVYGSKLPVCLLCKYVWIVGLSHLCDCYMYMIWLLGGRTAAVTLSARLCICYMICISVGFAVILFFRWLVTKTKETLSKFLQNE